MGNFEKKVKGSDGNSKRVKYYNVDTGRLVESYYERKFFIDNIIKLGDVSRRDLIKLGVFALDYVKKPINEKVSFESGNAQIVADLLFALNKYIDYKYQVKHTYGRNYSVDGKDNFEYVIYFNQYKGMDLPQSDGSTVRTHFTEFRKLVVHTSIEGNNECEAEITEYDVYTDELICTSSIFGDYYLDSSIALNPNSFLSLLKSVDPKFIVCLYMIS